MKNCYLRGLVFPLWCLSQSAAFADQFQDQLLQAGVSQEAVDTLVQHKYSKVEDLKSLTFEKLLQMGVKGKSALQIVEKFIYIQESASVKPLSSTTSPVAGQALKNRMDEILAMQKDLYEKTVEFDARRQGEIDKLTQQVETAAQQGDIGFQAAIVTIKNYDADTELLDFEIEWLDIFQSSVAGGTTETKAGSILIVPKEARNFPLGKQFPLFASVSWKGNGLHRAKVWLGNAGKTYLGFSPCGDLCQGRCGYNFSTGIPVKICIGDNSL